MAAVNDHAAVVQQLIDAGAVLDAADNAGGTALFCAASRGHPETVQQLVEAGAAGNTADHDEEGWTALMCCAGKGPVQTAADSGRRSSQRR